MVQEMANLLTRVSDDVFNLLTQIEQATAYENIEPLVREHTLLAIIIFAAIIWSVFNFLNTLKRYFKLLSIKTKALLNEGFNKVISAQPLKRINITNIKAKFRKNLNDSGETLA